MPTGSIIIESLKSSASVNDTFEVSKVSELAIPREVASLSEFSNVILLCHPYAMPATKQSPLPVGSNESTLEGGVTCEIASNNTYLLYGNLVYR